MTWQPLHKVVGSALVAFASVVAARADNPSAAPNSEQTKETRELVETALRYELEGENDRRQVMLNAALEANPNDALANWHAARVWSNDRWLDLSEAQRQAATDPTLTQYRQIRQGANTPDKLLALARWCARQGLREQAELHYTQLAAHPLADGKMREEAIKKLNLHDVGGVLLTKAELEAQKQAAEQIERAMKKWRPQFEEWRAAVEGDNPQQQALAASEMEQVSDPHVIPVAETFLADSGPRFGELLISLVARYEQHEATQALVRFAVLSPWLNVRRAATAQLKERPLHDYAPLLLAGLESPIESRWTLARTPDGSVRYQHVFYREGTEGNTLIVADHVSAPRLHAVGAELVGNPRATGRPVLQGFRPINDDRAQRQAARVNLAQAAARERAVAQENAVTAANNERIFQVLEETTQAPVARNAAQWWFWWQKYNEDVKPRPIQYLYVPTKSSFPYKAIAQYARQHSCFAAGTQVWTDTGLKPIEEIMPGDRVLSQDPNTGELAYKLVLETTVGQPTSPLMRLVVEGEEICPTLGHVVWVNGKGWRIAKRVELGDWLHGVSGALLVEEMEERPAPPQVYNLVVKDFHTYFVGKCGLLVHDITYRQPTRTLVPGLHLTASQ